MTQSSSIEILPSSRIEWMRQVMEEAFKYSAQKSSSHKLTELYRSEMRKTFAGCTESMRDMYSHARFTQLKY